MKKFGFLTLALVSLLFTACDPTEETTDVKVTGLTLNKTSIELEIEGTERLTVVKTPSNATTAIVWKSSVDSVASVSSTGIVTALKSGTTTITASADGHEATCAVTVLEPVAFAFTQGFIYGYENDFGYDETNTTEPLAQWIQAYVFTEDVRPADFVAGEESAGDGFGMNLQFYVPVGTGVAIPAGTYTFKDITSDADITPNTALTGGYNSAGDPAGPWMSVFIETDPDWLEAVGNEPGVYYNEPLIAGVSEGTPFDVSFEVSVEDGVYTFQGELAMPVYEGKTVIEGESDVYTFRFKGELPDSTPAGAPAAVRSLNTLNSKVRIPWLKK